MYETDSDKSGKEPATPVSGQGLKDGPKDFSDTSSARARKKEEALAQKLENLAIQKGIELNEQTDLQPDDDGTGMVLVPKVKKESVGVQVDPVGDQIIPAEQFDLLDSPQAYYHHTLRQVGIRNPKRLWHLH